MKSILLHLPYTLFLLPKTIILFTAVRISNELAKVTVCSSGWGRYGGLSVETFVKRPHECVT